MQKVQRVQRVYVIYDETNEPCSVAPTKATAQSYVSWFLDKDKKYNIQPFLVDTNKISQEEINNMLKEFSS